MNTLLLICPKYFKSHLYQFLLLYKRNNIKFSILEDNQKNNNSIELLTRDNREIKVKDLVNLGLELENINTIIPDTNIPFYIKVERNIIYPFNYNLKVLEEIKRSIKDATSVGYRIDCTNEIKNISSKKIIKIVGNKKIYLSSCSEMELNALATNYILLGNREKVLDPYGIISSKINNTSGELGAEIGINYGKLLKSLELFGSTFIDFS